MKFRNKPVVIEAEIWDGRSIDPMMVFLRSGKPWPKSPDDPHVESGIGFCPPEGSLDIPTLEGTMKAMPGDWIIKDVNGEFYPCKPDIFEKTYEPVDVAPSQAVETKADKFYSKCLKCGTPIYGTLEKISGKCDKCIPVAPAPLCEHYRGGTPFEACPFCAPKAQADRDWKAEFKNFHKNLCYRFGFGHDENEWYRDLACLEEHISGWLDRRLRVASTQPSPNAPQEREVTYKADFLWPHKEGSIEEAGYEFANGKTESYQKEWWKILCERLSARKERES